MDRSLVLGLALLLLAFAGLWWWSMSDAPAPPAAAVAEPEPAPTPDPTPQPPSTPIAPQPAVPEPAMPVAPAAAPVAPVAPAQPIPQQPAAAPLTPAPSASVLDTLTPEEAQVFGSLPRLKHAYEIDPVDAQAASVERELRAKFGTKDLPLDTLIGVRCATRVCKIDLRWTPDRPYTFMAASMALTREFSANAAADQVAELTPGGERHMALYVAREGYSPLDLEEPPLGQ